MSHDNHNHITEYKSHAVILILLLALTALTVGVTRIDLAAWNVGLALIIACIKATLVLLFFMHLKFDNFLFRVLVTAVILLFAVFIIITFTDYLFR